MYCSLLFLLNPHVGQQPSRHMGADIYINGLSGCVTPFTFTFTLLKCLFMNLCIFGSWSPHALCGSV